MGSCFSSSSSVAYNKSAARIISLKGSLTEYSAPITVLQVLGDSWCSCFVCDADKLHYDTLIPPMGPLEWLLEEHIYFILPFNMLDYPLTGPDMAALACKAIEALNNAAAAQDKHGRQASCSTLFKYCQ